VFGNGETRVNLKIVDRVNKSNTDINEPGFPISTDDLGKLEKNILNLLDENSIVVFSGSIPAGVPRDIYKTLIEKIKKYGAKTILDADGDLLKEGIQAGPYMVKPNINELERFCSKRLDNTSDVIRACKEFFKYGVKQVVVSLGKDGALFIKEEAVVLAHGLNVEVKSTVGAGDSMVAALAFSMERGYSLEEAVRLSVAASAANVMTSGTQAAELNQILELEKRVELEYIK
jgi:1-phosphofructokinase